MIIKLKDFTTEEIYSIVKKDRYSRETTLEAIADQMSKDLRYNTVTGKTFDNRLGLLGEYSSYEDIPTYENVLEVIEWEFSPYINNKCSMIKRGL